MTTSYTDLPAAMIAWLRSQPTIVSAFSEDISAPATTKFWGDEVEGSPTLPWAVYTEESGPQTYMTNASGNTPYLDEGAIRFVIVAGSKKTARKLARMIATALTDPPLQFQTGTLMFMRPAGKDFSAPTGEIAPNAPTAYARVLVIPFMVSRSTLT